MIFCHVAYRYSASFPFVFCFGIQLAFSQEATASKQRTFLAAHAVPSLLLARPKGLHRFTSDVDTWHTADKYTKLTTLHTVFLEVGSSRRRYRLCVDQLHTSQFPPLDFRYT